MNLKYAAKDPGNHFNISLLFIMLVIAIETLLFSYWYLILEPRFKVEATGNAQILAESEGRLIAQSLLSDEGDIQLNTVNEVMNVTLLLNDPLLNKPYFIGISIEIDPEVYHEQQQLTPDAKQGKLIHTQGNMNCDRCFSIEQGLYSDISNELIGLAHFQVNDAIFKKFKSDIKNKLLAEALIVLIIALLAWYATIYLVKQLHIQIQIREKAEAELREAKEKAETANEAKSQFLANMSHEIRTPLNAVIGMGYLVLKGELSTKQRNYLKKMDSSAHLLLSLINDILDFSKSESGKLELEHIKFTIDEVLDNINKVIVSKAEEKQIDLIFSISKHVPEMLLGDPLRLSQILLNLSNNAIKFTSDGTIVITIETIETKGEEITLQFSVTDTGIGIDEAQQKKLFQSFSQVDSSTTRKFGGTGLGLAISKQLTELMQGKIWVESQPNEGSTFSFTAVFGQVEQLDKYKRLPIELKNRPVLVIDDNKISLQVFAEMLQDFSFEVYTAESAEAGMRIIDDMNQKEHPIQLILMDWRLPGINGIEAARLIKNRSDLKVMPCIILITAYTNDEIIESARTYLDAYHPKPITPSYLYDSIITLFTDPTHTFPELESPKEQSNECMDTVLFRPDAKILLVEDNTINQEMAIEILHETQMTIDVANNGSEAVEKVQKNHYDLVLMDIQMPVMDGLKATTIIRQDMGNTQLPIIAMTAHALQDHKDEYLSTGMNDFIAKPIVIDHLFTTIQKWLPEAHTNLPPIDSRELINKQTLTNPFFTQTFPGIDMTEAYSRFKGNITLYIRLLNKFIENKECLLKDVCTHIKDNNWEEAGKFIHALKGTSGNLCINDIYTISMQLENSVKQKSIQTSLELLQQLTEAFVELRQSITQLQKLMNNDKNNEAPTENINQTEHHDKIDTVVIESQVEELEALILENNLRAKGVAEQLSLNLSHPDFEQALKQLNENLSNLDFDNALIVTHNISRLLK